MADRLGAPDGISAFELSSFPKRGTPSVGGKRQWGGPRGKVDKCQGGVFRGYVSAPDPAFVACRLSLPEEWPRDKPRRQQCRVPPAGRDQTRPAPCLDRLAGWGKQGPPGWGTGAAALGRHPPVRGALRERGAR